MRNPTERVVPKVEEPAQDDDTQVVAHRPEVVEDGAQGRRNGSRVGELEERLEAVLSAYTAAYLNIRGPEDCAYLGDQDSGYVLLPTTRNPPAPA